MRRPQTMGVGRLSKPATAVMWMFFRLWMLFRTTLSVVGRWTKMRSSLEHVLLWTAHHLRVLWCVVHVLFGMLVTWLQCKIPAMTERALAPKRRFMHPFTGNWEVYTISSSLQRLTPAPQGQI